MLLKVEIFYNAHTVADQSLPPLLRSPTVPQESRLITELRKREVKSTTQTRKSSLYYKKDLSLVSRGP